MSDQPTKKWFEDQIKACQGTIVANVAVAKFCQEMIDKGIYIAEGQKEVTDAIPN